MTTHSSRAVLARYYLRSLERAHRNESEPWYIENSDASSITLEHILPTNTMGNWPQFDEEQRDEYTTRLGNLALVKRSDNSNAKSDAFNDKRAIFTSTASYGTTKVVAGYDDWTPESIDERQAMLAELALKAWPIK